VIYQDVISDICLSVFW